MSVTMRTTIQLKVKRKFTQNYCKIIRFTFVFKFFKADPVHFHCKWLTATLIFAYMFFSKKIKDESKLFYVVIKMPQTELNLYWNQNTKTSLRKYIQIPFCTIPSWSDPSSAQTDPKRNIFAVRYNYAQGPSLLVSEIIFQPQSRGDDVTGEVTHSHGLSHQVNPIAAALTFSSLFLRKKQADPSATWSSTEHILAIVFGMKRRASSNPNVFFRLFSKQARHNNVASGHTSSVTAFSRDPQRGLLFPMTNSEIKMEHCPFKRLNFSLP